MASASIFSGGPSASIIFSSIISTPIGERSVYEKLLEIYRAAKGNSTEMIRKQFYDLPNTVRDKIYGKTYTLAGSPKNVEWNWGEIHVFDSLQKLQQAIQQIAFDTFDSLQNEQNKCWIEMPFHYFLMQQKNYIAYRVYINSGSPITSDACWGENHAKDNVEILFQSLGDCFPGVTAEMQTILNNWAAEGSPGEKRQKAVKRITEFLGDTSRNSLSLEFLSLKTLPPIFTSPFITRLKELDLSQNQLTALPPEIGNLAALQELYVRCNHLTTLPPEIGNLAALKELDVSNGLTARCEDLGAMMAFEEQYVSGNEITALPPEIGNNVALQVKWTPKTSKTHFDFSPLPSNHKSPDNSPPFRENKSCVSRGCCSKR